ncbi:MAG: methyltransferase domain-containing protein [Bacteroidota bacterium]
MNQTRIDFYDEWARSGKFDDQQKNLELYEMPNVLEMIYGLDPEHSIDLCCGTGRYIPALLEQSRTVVGVDASKEMLKAAKTKYRDFIGDRLCFKKIDIESQSLPSGRYDLALCTMAIGGFEDKQEAIRNVGSSMKTGGYLVISTYHPIQALRRKVLTSRHSDHISQIPFTKPWMVSEYFRALTDNRLQVIDMREPVFTVETAAMSGTHTDEVGWPHVLILKCMKV